ncbi:hypothetical protein QBC47DRAFT_309753 [Echria macrotheca]|uniref:BRCT domain-containing protein n=1 Tax=Echria macrotheca TaxID=438768 RepID=A0AAJ0F4Q9_9PEZI|nr:hypothetical protein QBC47DRAFT_309753 [Echria macrotheca]
MPFDPWNSSSTGHQVSESRGPQGWRESRTAKLQSQFRAGLSGGPRIADTAGRGAADFDEKHNVLIPKEVRARAVNSVADMLRKPGTMTMSVKKEDEKNNLTEEEKLALLARRREENEEKASNNLRRKGIFEGMVVYVNGSTHPLVSDHRLKRILAENGAQTALHLGRRKVTHREIRRVGGCGVKYVGVEWYVILESVKAGKRLPEARFANLKVAARGQQSVLGAFEKTDKADVAPDGSAQAGGHGVSSVTR